MHKPNEKQALQAAQEGKKVPDKLFSPPEKINAAAGTPQFGKPPPPATTGKKESHGYGHPVTARAGKLRCSGHSGAHRIGKRK